MLRFMHILLLRWFVSNIVLSPPRPHCPDSPHRLRIAQLVLTEALRFRHPKIMFNA